MRYIMCSRVFVSLFCVSYLLIGAKELRSSGKCNGLFLTRPCRQNAHEGSRYSNTLLVSLNNRIYFRDHPSPGAHVDTNLEQCHRSVMASLHFAQVTTHANNATLGDSYKAKNMDYTIDPEKGKADTCSIRSNPI
jgi:hypothetical protein